MNGPCYERHKATCAPTYAADYASQHASAPGTTEPRLVPESSRMFPPGTVLQTKVLPHDSADDVQGAAGTYASFMYKLRYQDAAKRGGIKITRPISDARGGILGEIAPAVGGAGGIALPPAVQRLVVSILERMPTIVADPRRQWEANGNRIRSCEEYTYEKFYSFSTFEDLIAQEGYRLGIGHDRRLIFQALVAAGGADGFIKPRGPGPNMALTGSDPTGPRNAFFARDPATLAPINWYETLRRFAQEKLGTAPFLFGFDSDLGTRVRAGMSQPGWGWALHAARGTAFLATTADDQFARMDLYKAQYADLLVEHDRLAKAAEVCLLDQSRAGDRLSAVPAWCNADLIHFDRGLGWTAPGPRHAANVESSELDIAVAEGNISIALTRARDELHCLETGDAAPCDWSPREFVNRMLLQARTKEEEVYDRCMRFTRGDLTSPASILTTLRDDPPDGYTGRLVPSDPPSGPGIDGTSSGDAFDAVMTAFERYVATLGFDRDPTTGKIIVGQSSGDTQTVDGGAFGVALEYGAQWRVDNFDASSAIYGSTPRGLCDSEAHTGGHAKLRAKILGEWNDVFEASGSVDTNLDAGVVTADLSILGHSFYSVSGKRSTLAVDLAFEESSTQSLGEARGIIPVLGVPVTLKAGATGTVGVEGGLSGAGAGTTSIAILRHCPTPAEPADTVTLGVHGRFEPFVRIDGYASASVDLGFAEGGIKGELLLARLGLPLDVEIGMTLRQPGPPQQNPGNGVPSGPPKLDLYTKTSLNLDFSTMDGHMSAFLETPISSDEFTIVSWQGLHYRHNVFERETHVPMSLLTTITHL
jgi:hypothetical protein